MLSRVDPVISVVLPCRNGGATLGEQLAALARQTPAEPWELVVVDNGSTDDSAAVAQRWCAGRPAWRVVHAAGPARAGYARNVGVRAARGDVLLFCDADDVVDDGWIAALSAALDDADLVAGRWATDRLNAPWLRAARVLPQTDGLQRGEPPWLPHAAANNLGMTRSLYEKVGPFDETLPALSDTDYCYRAQVGGHELVFVPGAVVHVRLRPSLAATYRQLRGYAEASVALHARYAADGMPAPDWRRGLGAWVLSVPRLLAIRDRAGLAAWVARLAWRVGRLRGSVRYRVLAP